MTYQRQVVAKVAPSSALTEQVFALRDTQFRLSCETAVANDAGTNAIAFTDPTTGTYYTPVGGGANIIARMLNSGDFRVLRTYFTDGLSNSIPGANIGILPWRGKDAYTIAAFIRFNQNTLSTNPTQHIIGDFSTSDGTGASFLRIGLTGGRPTLSGRHTLASETAVTAQLPSPVSSQWFGLIGEVEMTTGAFRLEDVLTGNVATAQGDPAVWNGPGGSPADGASFALTRGVSGSGGQGFIGDVTDLMFWDHKRSAAQLEHLRFVMRQRFAGLSV